MAIKYYGAKKLINGVINKLNSLLLMNEELDNMDDEFEDTDDPSDFKEEFKMWKLLAEQEDDAEAQLHLGQIYQYGLGVKEDDKEAVKWYRLAAEQGEPEAQYSLGWMYRCGWGVKEDDKEAVKWYRLAAEKEDTSACRHHLKVSIHFDAASVDLNNDNQDEVIVRKNDSYGCGSAGCDTFILHKIKGSWKIIGRPYGGYNFLVSNIKENGYFPLYYTTRYGPNKWSFRMFE